MINALELGRVRNPVLLVSALAWILLMIEPASLAAAHCSALSAGATPITFQMLLAMNPPGRLVANWALMLVAMMLPTLIPSLWHIRTRSFTHRRTRSAALFLAGYGAVWMGAGGVLVALQLAIKISAPQSNSPMAGMAIIALVWQCSPAKQRYLNRSHAHTEMAAFGPKADLDALLFGVTHGIWCSGSCWALMLLPMLLTRGHIAAMAAATVLILGERLEHPVPPCWRWRRLGKVKRFVVAQARIRLHAH